MLCHCLQDIQGAEILEEDLMKVTYEKEVDILRILFSDRDIFESDEQKPGIIIDYDRDGRIVGMEILNDSKNTTNPMVCDFAVA